MAERGMDRKAHVLVNPVQSIDFMNGIHQIVPHCCRSRSFGVASSTVPMTGEEALGVQGLGIFVPDSYGYECPFRTDLKQGAFTTTEMRMMAGNSMHLVVMQAWLIFMLGCTRSADT